MFSIRSNRALRLFTEASARINAEVGMLPAPVCFTHWETYGGSMLETGDLSVHTRVIRLLERKYANRLADKGKLAHLLKAHGLTHLAPATYHSLTEALEHDGPPVPVWFFKHVAGTAGKQMTCVAAADLASQELAPHYIIQAGIGELALIDGCKFTSRIYVLLWNRRAWLYRDGFTLKHGTAYAEGSTDFSVQIDHRGYHLPGSPVRMAPLSSYPEFDAYFPALQSLTRQLLPVLDECRLQTSEDTYLMLGIDVLFQTGGRVQLVEINTSPNFVHTDEINESINIPFFVAVMRTVLGRTDDVLLALA